MTENEKDYIKSQLTDYLSRITSKKGNKFICPLCSSGTGPNGTPAFTIVPGSNKTKFKCHSCGAGEGDIFDLYRMVNNTDLKTAFKELQRMYNIMPADNSYKQPTAQQQTAKPQQVDYTEFFIKAHSELNKCDYLIKRGISKEIQDRFNIGYVENWRHPNVPPKIPTTPRIIIPTSKYSYLARDTRQNVPENQKQYNKSKVGNMHIFNISDLEKEICFIVEGEIDALSVIQCGFPCIALGSVSMLNRLLTHCKKKKPSGVLIFALDNDQAGQTATAKIPAFQQVGIKCMTANISGNEKDPNDLLISDAKRLINNLQLAVDRAKIMQFSFPVPADARPVQENNVVISADETPIVEEPAEITAENILKSDTYNYIFSLKSEIEIDEYISKARQKAKEYRLTKEFDSLIKSMKKQALKELKARNKHDELNTLLEKQQKNREIYKIPDWILYDHWENPYINETAYINDYISNCELKCINGKMYSIDGTIDDRKLEHDVQESISPFIIKNIAQYTKRLVTALKNKCYSPPIKFNRHEIHVNNGLLMTDGTFIEEKRFCINRLNITYNPTAPQPTKWLDFLHDLLHDDDIKSLQEFLGYCLIPTTKSQVMMFIIGNGGEGKSVIGEILQEIYKQNMVTGKLNKIQTDRFFTANLESKLLFLDDDIDMQALPDTGKLKEVVTNPYHTIERKGVQGYETELCARLLCFGNGALNSLYDKTDGFYRRQIILKTKKRDKSLKKDNPMLRDEIVSEELQGVFNWMFAGLQRLISNNFNIYISEMAKQNLKDTQEENFNFITFLHDSSECQYGSEYETTTKEIFDEYEAWCHRNAYEPFKKNTISKYLASNANQLSIKPKRYVKIGDGKYSRGYEGIKIIKNGY